jgi:single-stranded-DNA-specific exonuclease
LVSTYLTFSVKLDCSLLVNIPRLGDDSKPGVFVKIMSDLPSHRWQIAPVDSVAVAELARSIEIYPDAPTSLLIAQVLINRSISSAAQVEHYVHGRGQDLPDPAIDFKDLATSVELLVTAIATKSKIAICGDYDADGMTSTALLIRALRALGADVDYAIPSRMSDGYGINERIVEKFHAEGIELVLTVDNGISAYDAIARAVELGLKVIVTDHHDLPAKLPPAHAILNPKLIPEDSVYYSIAGVGVAYLLAVALAEQLDSDNKLNLIPEMLELFTLGTIADLAALTGINRTLVRQGLKLLGNSRILGVQALITASGAGDSKQLKPEDIGFKLGPRINAVGRIGDPQTVIELLTTTDIETAQARAQECEATNRQRQELCAQIETEAIDLVESMRGAYQRDRVLVVVQDGWHHGVIGIVASRLVERYGVPVFIGTYEDGGHIRGSARSIPEFNIFASLEFCHDLLGKYGGHPAAGGFSMVSDNLPHFKDQLREFAHKCLEPEHLKPLVKIDAAADITEIDHYTYEQINAIQPCGIGNPEPVFWSNNVRVAEQKIIGKDESHLKVIVDSPALPSGIKGVGWRWAEYYPLPDRLDIAYKLRENKWQGKTNIEIELVSARIPVEVNDLLPPKVTKLPTAKKSSTIKPATQSFSFQEREYQCLLADTGKELKIWNADGQVLTAMKGQKTGTLTSPSGQLQEINVTEPHFFQLIKAAMAKVDC